MCQNSGKNLCVIEYGGVSHMYMCENPGCIVDDPDKKIDHYYSFKHMVISGWGKYRLHEKLQIELFGVENPEGVWLCPDCVKSLKLERKNGAENS